MAKVESELYSRHIGIYIHIPYCNSKCSYCNFVSFAGRCDYDEYVNSLCVELCDKSTKLQNTIVDTIYIGGGTPSVLPPPFIVKILNTVRSRFNVATNAEITMEANPNSITYDNIKQIADGGVNRVSVGLQTSNDDILRLIGRPHNMRNFEAAIEAIKKCGIDNVSCDMMLGLPTQTLNDVATTLKLIEQYNIKHISAYGLKVEKGTRLYGLVKSGKVVLPSEDTMVDMYDMVKSTLQLCKINRYEVSNFAVDGAQSRHNLNYWHCGEYLGVGVAAHSYLDGKRSANIQSIDKYIKRIKENNLKPSFSHKLTIDEQKYERIMLGLRLEQGMSITNYNKLYNADFVSQYKMQIDRLTSLDMVELVSCGDQLAIKVKPDKTYVLNSILVEFL